MTTKRIYDESPYISSYKSRVQNCNGLAYTFDESIFFPEKGGQKPDRGTINGIDLVDVQEVDGRLVHYLAHALEDDHVVMALDVDHRRDQMQQHCGEHILSGLLQKLYKGNNTGFHIGQTYATLDVDLKLTPHMVKTLEDQANRVIYEDLEVNIRTLADFDASKLRKPPSVDLASLEDIRVVEIQSVDAVTCCGTHPSRTGQVGIIKILKMDNYKGNHRLYFACGQRALEAFQSKAALLDQVHQCYNSNDDNLLDLMAQRDRQLQGLRRDHYEMGLAYAALVEHKQWQEGADFQFIVFETLDDKVFKAWLKTVDLRGLGFLCVYVENLSQVVICHDGHSPVDCKAVLQGLASYGGKGGGTHKRGQGKFERASEGRYFIKALKDLYLS